MTTSTTIAIENVTAGDSDPFDALAGLLRAYNEKHAGTAKWVPLYLFARDENGAMLGGLRGNTYWNWCYVEILAVAEAARGRGVGSKLLADAEVIARNRGCQGVYLWTMSFQAPEFYRRHGYTEFGRIEEFLPGHAAHWVMKRF